MEWRRRCESRHTGKNKGEDRLRIMQSEGALGSAPVPMEPGTSSRAFPQSTRAGEHHIVELCSRLSSPRQECGVFPFLAPNLTLVTPSEFYMGCEELWMERSQCSTAEYCAPVQGLLVQWTEYIMPLMQGLRLCWRVCCCIRISSYNRPIRTVPLSE